MTKTQNKRPKVPNVLFRAQRHKTTNSKQGEKRLTRKGDKERVIGHTEKVSKNKIWRSKKYITRRVVRKKEEEK